MMPEIIAADSQEAISLSFQSDVYPTLSYFGKSSSRQNGQRRPNFTTSRSSGTQREMLTMLIDPARRIPQDVHRDLLRRMWQPEPDARPMFWQIVEQLEQRELWLHRQATEEFLRYVKELNAEERQIAPDATSRFRRLLRKVPGGYESVECLNDPRIHLDRDRSTEKLIYSLRIVYWSDKIPNEGVVDPVRQSLENQGWLNPIKINKSAAQPANLVELI
jgi:hypothetical protein